MCLAGTNGMGSTVLNRKVTIPCLFCPKKHSYMIHRIVIKNRVTICLMYQCEFMVSEINRPNNAFCCNMTPHTNCKVIHISVCELTWNFLQTISTEMIQGLPADQNECKFYFSVKHTMTDLVYKIQSVIWSSVTTWDANGAVFLYHADDTDTIICCAC